MSAEHSKTKCAHEGCVCEVDPGQTYCGPFCATSAGETISTDQPCDCGHERCKRAARPMAG
jgi:hypothetical protein